jgi:hypothetical protein
MPNIECRIIEWRMAIVECSSSRQILIYQDIFLFQAKLPDINFKPPTSNCLLPTAPQLLSLHTLKKQL